MLTLTLLSSWALPAMAKHYSLMIHRNRTFDDVATGGYVRDTKDCRILFDGMVGQIIDDKDSVDVKLYKKFLAVFTAEFTKSPKEWENFELKNEEATARNTRKRLKLVQKQMRAGDVLFLYMATHGGVVDKTVKFDMHRDQKVEKKIAQVEKNTVDAHNNLRTSFESGEMSESQYCDSVNELRKNGMKAWNKLTSKSEFKSDELVKILSKIPETCTVIAFFPFCYTGNILRLPYTIGGKKVLVTDVTSCAMPSILCFSGSSRSDTCSLNDAGSLAKVFGFKAKGKEKYPNLKATTTRLHDTTKSSEKFGDLKTCAFYMNTDKAMGNAETNTFCEFLRNPRALICDQIEMFGPEVTKENYPDIRRRRLVTHEKMLQAINDE